MLKTGGRTKAESPLSLARSRETRTEMTEKEKMAADRLLRRPRSKKYMEMMGNLDAGGHARNSEQVEAILDGVRREFPEVNMDGILLGFVSKCYLGGAYEVHSLDAAGGIVRHYERGQPLPGGMEKARSIAIGGGYEFIEVYSDCCRAVDASGNVSVIK